MLPIEYVAIDEPPCVQNHYNVRGEEEPQVFVAQLLDLHQLVHTHYHVREVHTEGDTKPQFEVATAGLGTRVGGQVEEQDEHDAACTEDFELLDALPA